MKKTISLRALLFRYLLSTAVLCLGLGLVWLFGFGILLNCGFLLPASSAAEA